jgi:FtsZ-binding cell division protein ZapB
VSSPARFRAKKKERDRQLERSAGELRERVSELEREAESLKKENRYGLCSILV